MTSDCSAPPFTPPRMKRAEPSSRARRSPQVNCRSFVGTKGEDERTLFPQVHMKVIQLTMALLALPVQALAGQGERVAFEGRPVLQLQSGFLATVRRDLSEDQGFEYQVRIIERNGRYFWATRQMIELARSEGGSYTTYVALNGAGYIRVGSPLLLDLRDRLPAEDRQREIGYVEHLLTQLESVTYYGNRTDP